MKAGETRIDNFRVLRHMAEELSERVVSFSEESQVRIGNDVFIRLSHCDIRSIRHVLMRKGRIMQCLDISVRLVVSHRRQK